MAARGSMRRSCVTMKEHNTAQFRVHITIISAANLRSAEQSLFGTTKPDSYCLCRVEGRPWTSFKTDIKQKTCEPQWNYEKTIDGVKDYDSLEFFIYDPDRQSECLGSAQLPFKLFCAGFDDDLEVTCDLPGKPGKVPPSLRVKVDVQPMYKKEDPNRACVKVLHAEALKDGDWNVENNGKCDPFCVVTIPGKHQPESQTIRTRVRHETIEPVWDEEAELFNYEPGDDIKFQVFDYEENRLPTSLGQTIISSRDFHPHGFEGTVALGIGTLTVNIDIETPKTDEMIVEPGVHICSRDREPAPFQLRSVDTGKVHRLVAFTRIGRSERKLEKGVDLILDSPGINDVSRLHAVIKCWRTEDPNVWCCHMFSEKGREGFGGGPGGGHAGGGTSVDGHPIDDDLGLPLEPGSIVRFGVREMWVLENATMHARSPAAEVACNRAAANAAEDPTRMKPLTVSSQAVESALQRCPDWMSLVRVVLECRNEPDEPPCVDCIEIQDEVGRPVIFHEASTLEEQESYPIRQILREVRIGCTIKLRISSDPKLLAPILQQLEEHQSKMAAIYKSRQANLG